MSNDTVGLSLSGSFHFGDQCLFEDLHLSLPAGEWTCLLGASGIGKSTLLRLLANLPTNGQFVGQISADDKQPVASRIAYMAQSDLLYPWLSVHSNVMLGSRLRGEANKSEQAEQLIEQVGLTEHRDKKPNQLSGGMRQRVALARTLMEDTPFVLLDEPFSALDSRTRHEMQTLAFNALKHKTVLLVTHDAMEALRLAHHLFVMTESGLVQQSPPPSVPLRKLHDADVLSVQSNVLAALAGDYE